MYIIYINIPINVQAISHLYNPIKPNKVQS